MLKNWYVVQSKSKSEATAAAHLANQQFEVYLPIVSEARKRGGRWCSVEEPLFPGYLFISLDTDHQNTSSIRSTRGVVGLVRQGAALSPMPKGYVENLMSLQMNIGSPIDLSALFNVGDEVLLTEGPMQGMKAVFGDRCGQERVIVLLNLLGSEARTTVSVNWIEKAS